MGRSLSPPDRTRLRTTRLSAFAPSAVVHLSGTLTIQLQTDGSAFNCKAPVSAATAARTHPRAPPAPSPAHTEVLSPFQRGLFHHRPKAPPQRCGSAKPGVSRPKDPEIVRLPK